MLIVALEDSGGETGFRVGRLLLSHSFVISRLKNAKAAHYLVAQSDKLKSYFLPCRKKPHTVGVSPGNSDPK